MLPTFSYLTKVLCISGMWVVHFFFNTQTPDFTRHYCDSTKDQGQSKTPLYMVQYSVIQNSPCVYKILAKRKCDLYVSVIICLHAFMKNCM